MIYGDISGVGQQWNIETHWISFQLSPAENGGSMDDAKLVKHFSITMASSVCVSRTWLKTSFDLTTLSWPCNVRKAWASFQSASESAVERRCTSLTALLLLPFCIKVCTLPNAPLDTKAAAMPQHWNLPHKVLWLEIVMCPEIEEFCILEEVDCRMELVSDVEELSVQVLKPIVKVLVRITEPFGKVLAQLVLSLFRENSSGTNKYVKAHPCFCVS